MWLSRLTVVSVVFLIFRFPRDRIRKVSARKALQLRHSVFTSDPSVRVAAISSPKGCLNLSQLDAYRSPACAPCHHGLGLPPLPFGGCGWGWGGPFLLPVGVVGVGPPPLWVWLGLGGVET